MNYDSQKIFHEWRIKHMFLCNESCHYKNFLSRIFFYLSPFLPYSIANNHSMNQQNQPHPVQLVAKFTAFPAINSPSYSSRMVSSSPAVASSIVGIKRRLLRKNSFLGCINLKIRKFWGSAIISYVLILMHPN